MDSAQILRHILNVVWHCPDLREAVFASPESGGHSIVEAVSRGG